MNLTRKPTSPGELLKHHYLDDRDISIAQFAGSVGCSAKHMSQIVHGHARITAEMAMKIGLVLGTSAEMWINGQNKIDLYNAQQALKNWKPKKLKAPAKPKSSS